MELLMILSSAGTCLFEAFLFFYFERMYAEQNRITSKYMTVLLLLAVGTGFFTINQFHNEVVNVTGILTVIFLFSWIFFEMSLMRRILVNVVFIVILMGCELIATLVLLWGAGDQYERIVRDSMIGIVTVTAVKLISFLLLMLIGHMTVRHHPAMEAGRLLLLLLFPLASFAIYLGIGYSALTYHQFIQNPVLIGGCFLLLFANAAVFYLFEWLAATKETEKKLQAIEMGNQYNEAYYNKIIALEQEHQKKLHDMKHQIHAMIRMSEKNMLADMKRLEQEITLKDQQSKPISMDPLIDMIMEDKQSTAQKKHISMEEQIASDFCICNLERMEVIGLLSNLLDNAIEAAEKVKEDPFVCVSMQMENQATIALIMVENSYNPSEFRNYRTTKANPEGHGYGISNIAEIAEKYDGYFRTEQSEKTFKAFVVLSVYQ